MANLLKKRKMPTWETRALEFGLDCATGPGKSFSKMRALNYMKFEVFLTLWLCTEQIFISEHKRPNTKGTSLPIMAPSPLFLALPSTPCSALTDPLPTQPRSSNWPYCQSFFARGCDLITMVRFGYVFSLLRDQNNGRFLHLHSETPAVVCRPRGKVVRLERRGENSVVVFLYPCFRSP